MIELLNTKLDAVNLCLSGIGREPVATVETADLDSAMALAIIDQTMLDIQMNDGKGWWFNKESKWRLEPDSNGRIILPNNTLSILEARGSFYDVGNRLTVRGRRVYDTDDHTFDLRHAVDKSGKIEFSLVLLLPFEELPATARSAISWRARRLFGDDTVGDNNQSARDQQNEMRAYHSLEAEHRRVTRLNYLRDNSKINSQLGLIGGVNNMYR